MQPPPAAKSFKLPWVSSWQKPVADVATFGVSVTPLEAEASLLAHWADKSFRGLGIYGAHAHETGAGSESCLTPEMAAFLHHGIASEVKDFFEIRERYGSVRPAFERATFTHQ